MSREPEVRILLGNARLDDKSAMDQLIKRVPKGRSLRKMLKTGLATSFQLHQERARTFRHVVTDGERVQCFTVENVTATQAAAIAAECKSIHDWSSPKVFICAVDKVLSGDAERAH